MNNLRNFCFLTLWVFLYVGAVLFVVENKWSHPLLLVPLGLLIPIFLMIHWIRVFSSLIAPHRKKTIKLLSLIFGFVPLIVLTIDILTPSLGDTGMEPMAFYLFPIYYCVVAVISYSILALLSRVV